MDKTHSGDVGEIKKTYIRKIILFLFNLCQGKPISAFNLTRENHGNIACQNNLDPFKYWL